jgi:hypothetical protein
MKRLTYFIALSIVAVYGCSDRETVQKRRSDFSQFEISYSDGWMSGFRLIADSNKIYFFPGRADTTNYGILPDEIFNAIDSTIATIEQRSPMRSMERNCYDCYELSIRIVSNEDTIQIKQFDKIDPLFQPLIHALENFIYTAHHQQIQALLMFESEHVCNPLTFEE